MSTFSNAKYDQKSAVFSKLPSRIKTIIGRIYVQNCLHNSLILNNQTDLDGVAYKQHNNWEDNSNVNMWLAFFLHSQKSETFP